MAFWLAKVYDKNNALIGYTDYNNTVCEFTIPIFKSKDLLNKWWRDELEINKSECIEEVFVILEGSHGRVNKTLTWNAQKGYGFITGDKSIHKGEWTRDNH